MKFLALLLLALTTKGLSAATTSDCRNGMLYPADSVHDNHCQEGMLYAAETKYGFNTCLGGKLIYQRCAVGFYFDLIENSCLEEQDICEEGRVYAAENKYGFLYCQNGVLTFYECPNGMIFDESLAICYRLKSY